MKKYSILYKQDLRLLSTELVKTNCPACSSTRFQNWCSKMGFTFMQCVRCKTVFVNPRPSESSLEQFYTKSKAIDYWDKIFKKTEKIRIEQIFKPRVKLVFKILQNYGIKRCTKLVEVGAGYGWFCKIVKQKNLAKEIIAIEPSQKLALSCRRLKGIKVIESTIEKTINELESHVIVSFELVHLLFNPIEFLTNCFNKLKKDGVLIFSLTNFYGLDIQILKEKSEYVTPTFLTLFNQTSIQIALKKIGFKNIQVTTPGLLDVPIILNKLRSQDLKGTDCPFFKLVLDQKNERLVGDIQNLLQKYNMSSHMVVAAQK